MSNKTLHIGDMVQLRDGRVGILRTISRTGDGVSVEVELRSALDFAKPIGWAHGSPESMGLTKL